jgi:hypothetical protein
MQLTQGILSTQPNYSRSVEGYLSNCNGSFNAARTSKWIKFAGMGTAEREQL